MKIVGKMTLNRNVDNVLQKLNKLRSTLHISFQVLISLMIHYYKGRLFSYTDTQISRLGGPNFNQIPINRPVAEVHNNQRDAMHQSYIHQGQTAYHKMA